VEPKFINLEELSRLTHLPAAWLKREADAQRIPCLRAGKRRLFDLAAVLKALAAQQQVGGNRDN
jgi:hypothetical protein